MSVQAGKLNVTVEYADGLRERNHTIAPNKSQDPYAIIKVGKQTLKTKVIKDAATNPVFDETLSCNITEEKDVEITLKDSDILIDGFLGRSEPVSLATVRQSGTDRQSVPLYTKKGDQAGAVNVRFDFQPNGDAVPQSDQVTRKHSSSSSD